MEQETLKQYREQAGLSLAQAAALLKEREPSAPDTRQGLRHIEERGTDSIRILKALAAIYNVDYARLADVAVKQVNARERVKVPLYN